MLLIMSVHPYRCTSNSGDKVSETIVWFNRQTRDDSNSTLPTKIETFDE